MKEEIRKEKGITLISLIITIIILLILAMVSVSIVINSGLIGHTENAAMGYKEQERKEMQSMYNLSGVINSVIDKYYTNQGSGENKEWDCSVNGHYWCTHVSQVHGVSYSNCFICKFCYKAGMSFDGGENHVKDEKFLCDGRCWGG